MTENGSQMNVKLSFLKFWLHFYNDFFSDRFFTTFQQNTDKALKKSSSYYLYYY